MSKPTPQNKSIRYSEALTHLSRNSCRSSPERFWDRILRLLNHQGTPFLYQERHRQLKILITVSNVMFYRSKYFWK